MFTKNDALTKATEAILDQVAEIIIKGNLIIGVEVHVPLSTKSGNKNAIAKARSKDKSSSQKRADAVVDYLVSKGVAGVQGVGLGSDRPLGNNPETDPLNDRVNFIKKVQGGTP